MLMLLCMKLLLRGLCTQKHCSLCAKVRLKYTPLGSSRLFVAQLSPAFCLIYYHQGDLQMRGMKKLTVFSRRVVSAAESQLDLSAPALTQTFRTQVFGDDGRDGKDGAAGPVGRAFRTSVLLLQKKNHDMYCDWLMVRARFTCITQGRLRYERR